MVFNRDFLDELVLATSIFASSMYYFLEGNSAILASLLYLGYLLLPANVSIWPLRYVTKAQFTENALNLELKSKSWKEATAACGPATHEQYVVVGGAGFVGSHMVHALVVRGETKVRIVDMDVKGMAEIAAKYTTCKVECVKADVTKLEEITEALKGATCVYSPFAVLRYWESLERHWYNSININVGGTKTLIDACVKVGVQRLVVTSSSAALETFPGWIEEGINEDSPLCTWQNYSNNYALSKALQEEYALPRNGEGGLAIGAIRPCSEVFGYGDKLLLKMAFDSKQYPCIDAFGCIDHVHVDNIVLGHLLLEKRLRNGPQDAAAGRAFCISNGEAVSGGDFAALCKYYANRHGFELEIGFHPIRIVTLLFLVLSVVERIYPGDMVRLLGPTAGKLNFSVVLQATHKILVQNSSAPKEILGYEPYMSVRSAVEHTMKEYKEDRIIMD